MQDALDAALTAGSGVVSRRAHPELRHAVDAARRAGRLVSVLPGVYARSADAPTPAVRARAAVLADPQAVVVGAGAAFLAGWAGVEEPATLPVTTGSARPQRAGFLWRRQTVPATLVRRVDGYRITTNPLTALDLIGELGEDALDIALRRGVKPAAMLKALDLTAGRAGHGALRRLVRDARAIPWSPAERAAHVLLRQAQITGWEANRAVYDRRGEEKLGYSDLVFASLRLVIEIDGDAHHRERATLLGRQRRPRWRVSPDRVDFSSVVMAERPGAPPRRSGTSASGRPGVRPAPTPNLNPHAGSPAPRRGRQA